MHSQAQLQDDLTSLAETVRPSAEFEAKVHRRAGRIRARRRVAGVSVAVVCTAVMVSVFQIINPAAGPQLTASPPDGPFLGWATAGGAADASMIGQATDAWDGERHASAGPHTAARAILATHDQLLGAVMVLQAYDKNGVPRVGFFTSDSGNGGALTLRADRPAPDPVSTQVLSMVSSRLTGSSGTANTDYWGTYAIAVAMPGVTGLRVDSTAIDQMLRQGSGHDGGRFVVQQLPISATAASTTITGFAKSRKVFQMVAGGGASGDAQAVQARIVGRDRQEITVTLDGSRRVRPGQLAVATEGLVGRVMTVDPGSTKATIALVTSSLFSCQVYTDISNVTGTARGTGEKVRLEDIPLNGDAEVNKGNRVLTPDPAQGNDKVGAITIGRATTAKPADGDAVELTPAVDVNRLQEVSIMTPFSPSNP